MLPLIDMPSLPFRLKVWAFSSMWEEERVMAENYCVKILGAYAEIKNNLTFRQILGQILAVGNVLNGGSAKGQADGFDVPVFGKLTSMRDKEGKSLIEYIMLQMKNQDDTINVKLKDLIEITCFKDCDNEYVKNKTRELQAMHGNAKSNFEQVKSVSATDRYVSQSIEEDLFMMKMGQIIDSTEKELNLVVSETQKVLDTHKEICDFYDIDAKDEMREKSEPFFKLFGEFFKLCEKSLPTPPKKSAWAAPKK